MGLQSILKNRENALDFVICLSHNIIIIECFIFVSNGYLILRDPFHRNAFIFAEFFNESLILFILMLRISKI